MNIIKALTTLLVLFFSANSYALRCNSKIVSVGDSSYKFFSLCGEPDFVEKRTAYRYRSIADRRTIIGNNSSRNSTKRYSMSQRADSYSHSSANQTTRKPHDYLEKHEIEHNAEEVEEVQIEEWIYDFGPHRLVQKVIFVDGVAKKINDMGYGVSKSD